VERASAGEANAPYASLENQLPSLMDPGVEEEEADVETPQIQAYGGGGGGVVVPAPVNITSLKESFKRSVAARSPRVPGGGRVESLNQTSSSGMQASGSFPGDRDRGVGTSVFSSSSDM